MSENQYFRLPAFSRAKLIIARDSRVVLMGAWDSLKGQRSKLQGYMSESVQSDIKLSF